MTPWLIAYASGMALALAFNHAAHRKPSPRPAPSRFPTTDRTRGTVDLDLTIRVVFDPDTDTTGLRCVEDTDTGSEVWT